MGSPAAGNNPMPLAAEQMQRVSDAVAGLSPEQLNWVSGYLAGLGANDAAAEVPQQGRSLSVLYGSQTGNGEGIAQALASRARKDGYACTVTSLADYRPGNLKRESLVTFVVSTHGEGDPPDDAELFHEFLQSPRAPRLDSLDYAVLALGDSSYVNFCQTGREFDQRLEALGARRLIPIVECDLDYEDAAERWSGEVLGKLPGLLDAAVPQLRAVETVARFDKHHPFAAEVLVNQKITGAGSSKDVRHIELSLEGSGLSYEPGDSLAVVAQNPPQLVRQFIDRFGEDDVRIGDDVVSFGDALSRHLEITAVNVGFLRHWADVGGSPELASLLGQPGALQQFVDTHQVIDVVRRYPADVDAARFAAGLRRLAPRSYSIASSHSANPDEVHLTVAVVRYDAFGERHWGAASTHLADRLEPGDTIPVYIEKNSRFRLPDDDAPIVMIGPGTGIAPFRAFVEERADRGACGRNWLFFGDRNFRTDFLYQLEWLRHLKHGRLHRVDVAFSRDQDEKVYVQDRIRECGAELYDWIEEGAFVYVCGDAKSMAGDVNDALVDVIAQQARIGRGNAEEKLRDLRRAGRYQRDVY